jgi:hypothetical protein
MLLASSKSKEEEGRNSTPLRDINSNSKEDNERESNGETIKVPMQLRLRHTTKISSETNIEKGGDDSPIRLSTTHRVKVTLASCSQCIHTRIFKFH